MRLGAPTLPVPTSVAAGAAVDITQYGDKCVTLEGTFALTAQLQLSCDSANPPAATSWINEGTALTAVGNLLVTKPGCWLRWNVTAFTSGAATSRMAGVMSTNA